MQFIFAMIGFGFFKGIYDSNIWASLYDVVGVKERATTLGMMNSVGWVIGGAGAVSLAKAAEHFGMSACISATSGIYLITGLLLFSGTLVFMRRVQS